jgi:hypothetical protein
MTAQELKGCFLVDENGKKKYEYMWFEFLKKSKNFTAPNINDVVLFNVVKEAI